MSLQNINTYTYTPGFQLGQYHNAVLCISGNVQSLYLDGTLIATKTGTTNVLANYSTINQILIGCAGDKSSGFSGYLDDFRMYNYTLNQAQVSNLYVNRNIVAYYPFDNSLNSQTPNYATLTYDATLVGSAATITTSTSNVGKGSLQLTNTSNASLNYLTSSSGFYTSATNGLSISLWFKATGVSGSRMRLFDLCAAAGSQGILVDISGTNQILAGYNGYTPPAPPATWSNFYDNLSTFVSSTLGYTGGTGTSTRYFSTSTSTPTFTFTTNKATWTYTNAQSNGFAVDLFYKGSAESPYFFNNQDNYLTDTPAWGLFLQCSSNTTSTKISTPLTFSSSGNYTVSFAIMQSIRTGSYLGSFINIKVSLGSSYIIFNNTGSTYTNSGNVSISAYYYDGSAYTTPSTLMASNPAINNLKTKMAFVTLTFTNMTAGTNILEFDGTSPGDGFMISQIGVNLATTNSTGGDYSMSVGNYKYHVFTNSGTFTIDTAKSIEYIIIGGGGAGGSSHGGGGGAGRIRTGTYSATPTSYTVTVGIGGVPSSNYSAGNGGNSSVFGITAEGGGYGGGANPILNAVSGGSGGGGAGYTASITPGTAIRTTATNDYGNAGGSGYKILDSPYAGGGGGGGGSGSVGGNAPSGTYGNGPGGNGGDGTSQVSSVLADIYSSMPSAWKTAVNSSGTYYIAGGGGGGTWGPVTAGTGGKGGGGQGSNVSNTAAASTCNGIANTGSGGGGGGDGNSTGASGGSGIVILRY